MLSPATVPEDFRDRVAPFLSAHGFAGDLAIEPVVGGGNNRVYRVQTTARAGLLKAYFQNPADPRDRFGAERAFYEYLWGHGVRRTPEPLGWDDEQRLGLFTFVTGRKLRPEEITSDTVAQALAFIAELNSSRTTLAARQLPLASEACFSVSNHLACVERRVARLAQIETATALEREAETFVTNELQPAWRGISAAMSREPKADELLRPVQRCLSPSDFGFHNALLTDDGQLRFIDFEYAGWDDPAKLVCDFFCQPELSVGLQHWGAVVQRLAELFGPPADLPARAARLLPAYQIKWCCIMLNEFLRVGAARRSFAAGAEMAGNKRKQTQLVKARRAFAEMQAR